MSLTKLIDMRLTSEEKMEEGMMMPFNQHEYPYGLSISLDNTTLEKLGVDHDNFEIGDIYDLRAMARVTSVSSNETESGECCRVEMQIVMLGCENESSEDDEEEAPRKRNPRLYKK